MVYKNEKTGAVINIPCELTGGDWAEVETSTKSGKKKAVNKDDAVCDDN